MVPDNTQKKSTIYYIFDLAGEQHIVSKLKHYTVIVAKQAVEIFLSMLVAITSGSALLSGFVSSFLPVPSEFYLNRN